VPGWSRPARRSRLCERRIGDGQVVKKGFVGPLARRVSRGGIGRIMLAGDVDFRKVMNAFKSIGYQKAFTAEIVPGMLGAVEKALAALKIIEKV